MDKRAQKRDRLHKLREKIDFFGQAAENFSPKFGNLMEKLRQTDEKVRESLLEEDPRLKDVLKSARSNFNRREYMTSIAELKKFHDKMDAVVKILKGLMIDVDEAHNDFIFKDLSSDTISGLKSLRDKFEEKKAASRAELLVKEAGIGGDLWHLLTEERPKAMRAWEKRYPGRMKELKTKTNGLIRKSEVLFSTLLVSLKEMSSARAARNLDKYVKAVEKLVTRYDEYNVEFKDYYQKHIQGFVNKLLAQEAEKAKTEEMGKAVKTEETGLGNKEIAPPSSRGPDTSPFAPSPGSQSFDPSSFKDPLDIDNRSVGPASSKWMTPPSNYDGLRSEIDPTGPTLPSPRVEMQDPISEPPHAVRSPAVPQSSGTRSIDVVNPVIPKAPRVPEDLLPSSVRKELQQQTPTVRPGAKHAPDTIPAAQWAPDTEINPSKIGPGTLRSAHPLVKTLQVLSAERPEVLALEISKYATSIQKTNPIASAKLFAIVEKILNG